MEKAYQKLNLWVKNYRKYIRFIAAGCILLFALPAKANMTIISDEETEGYLESLIRPIFQAAGISFNRDKIFIVQDNSLNAFVSDGNNLFIHTETILKAQTPDELRGVLAHETGHIQGGHIVRQKLRIQEMQNISLASIVAAGAIGAAAGRGDAAAAIALGTHGSLLNQSLAYKIQEERSADEAAVTLLKKTGHSPKGLFDFMKKIQTLNKLQGVDDHGYFRTHPLTEERLTFLRQAVKSSPYKPEITDSRLKRIQAKLFAFVKPVKQTFAKYPASDNRIDAVYARAIAAFKSAQLNKAENLVAQLIKVEPQNPHFRELSGQIFLEQGKIREAQKEFATASSLMPKSVLFKINQAQATLELSPSPSQLSGIIRDLQQAVTGRQIAIAWLLLSKAYYLSGKKAEAQYAAARYSAAEGDYELAKRQAEDAKKNVTDKKLSLKIDDLLQFLKNIKTQ